MDVPKTTGRRDPAEDVAAAAQGGRCPVDHGGAGSTSAESAIAPPPIAISATELPAYRKATLAQMFEFWKSPPNFMAQCRDRYGSRFAVSIKLPPKPVYVLSDPADLKAMFLAPADVLHTGNGSGTIEKYTGQTGLAWLDEDQHKERRKLLMPSMHGKALQRIGAAIAEMAETDVATWPRSENTALHPYIQRYAFHALREVIFGSVAPSCWDELADVLIRMMQFNDHIGSVLQIHRMPSAVVRLLTAIRPLGLYDFLKLRKRADALLAEAVEERRNSGEHGDDLLSVLLGITHEDGSPLSATELRDEIMTIFIAGTETTTVAIAWAFEYLSCDRAALDRLVAEIDAGTDDAYLTATVQEVLRLRPSLPQIIPREVIKPIEIGGVRYEPGMVLWGSAYLMNRDPVVYPAPDAFRPERFLDSRPGTYTWIPFGGGRVRCLGDKIAMLEMKAVIREVLARCELHRVDQQPAEPRSRIVVIMPSNGTRLELRPRAKVMSAAMD
ncbi:cytochrome P450 [Nocardia sp. CA-128927]|uniref:cytochrome P450 n=1 Tax=Nocardia sp. CA-128927 TaxID=3239975 RepID=UPI003D97A3C2